MVYIYIYIFVYIYIYIYIYMKASPLPSALQGSRDPGHAQSVRLFEVTADHLSAIGGSRACLSRSLLAAGGDLGRHVGGPWRCQGLGLGPGLARGRQHGLDCTPVRAGALFYWDPGIQGIPKV